MSLAEQAFQTFRLYGTIFLQLPQLSHKVYKVSEEGFYVARGSEFGLYFWNTDSQTWQYDLVLEGTFTNTFSDLTDYDHQERAALNWLAQINMLF